MLKKRKEKGNIALDFRQRCDFNKIIALGMHGAEIVLKMFNDFGFFSLHFPERLLVSLKLSTNSFLYAFKV